MSRCPNCGYQSVKSNKGRSNPQNKYFHGVVIPILAFHTGYDDSDMKGVIKYHFGIKSTSDLSTAEFELFMTKIRMWASKPVVDGGLGVYIPEPNDQCAMTEACAR